MAALEPAQIWRGWPPAAGIAQIVERAAK